MVASQYLKCNVARRPKAFLTFSSCSDVAGRAKCGKAKRATYSKWRGVLPLMYACWMDEFLRLLHCHTRTLHPTPHTYSPTQGAGRAGQSLASDLSALWHPPSWAGNLYLQCDPQGRLMVWPQSQGQASGYAPQ